MSILADYAKYIKMDFDPLEIVSCDLIWDNTHDLRAFSDIPEYARFAFTAIDRFEKIWETASIKKKRHIEASCEDFRYLVENYGIEDAVAITYGFIRRMEHDYITQYLTVADETVFPDLELSVILYEDWAKHRDFILTEALCFKIEKDWVKRVTALYPFWAATLYDNVFDDLSDEDKKYVASNYLNPEEMIKKFEGRDFVILLFGTTLKARAEK